MQYTLKPKIPIKDFSLAVNRCKGEVTYETPDGDVLNLKSELSKYIFLALSMDTSHAEPGKISCSPQDATLLTEYIALP